MPHDNFRQSPIYQAALRARDVMGQTSPCFGRRRYYHANQVDAASQRLDHLIRNALVLDEWQHLDSRIICAIKSFLRHLDRTLPQKVGVPPMILNSIRAKMDFCRQLCAASDQERIAVGALPLIVEWFEEKIVKHGSTMEIVVYENPFGGLYAGMSGGSKVYANASTDCRLNAFHLDMREFWE